MLFGGICELEWIAWCLEKDTWFSFWLYNSTYQQALALEMTQIIDRDSTENGIRLTQIFLIVLSISLSNSEDMKGLAAYLAYLECYRREMYWWWKAYWTQ